MRVKIVYNSPALSILFQQASLSGYKVCMTEIVLDWNRLYREYMPEIIEVTIQIYEHLRNRDAHGFTPPKDTPRYAVDRKRYDTVFWEELVWEFVKVGKTPDAVYYGFDTMMQGKGPWPDLLRSQAGMSHSAHLAGWRPVVSDPLNFDPLPEGSEAALQKMINAHEKQGFESFSSFTPAAKLCVYLSRPQYWDSLCCEREYRFIFGRVLYLTMSKRNRDVFEKLMKSLLCPFIATKLSPLGA